MTVSWFVIFSGSYRDNTIIDGNQNGSVVTLSGKSVINGFTVVNGSGTILGNINVGGGIWVSSNDTVYILNCNFSNNDLSSHPDSRGGGVNGNAYTFIDNCIFSNNFVTQYGSAIASGYITNCEFKNNGKNTVDYPRQIKNCLFVL